MNVMFTRLYVDHYHGENTVYLLVLSSSGLTAGAAGALVSQDQHKFAMLRA
jgi:hypothetical protein